MNLSPNMEILQYNDITAKGAVVPIVTQIGEVIFNEVPSNPFIVGFQELYLNSDVEEFYENMKVDLGTGQE